MQAKHQGEEPKKNNQRKDIVVINQYHYEYLSVNDVIISDNWPSPRTRDQISPKNGQVQL